MKKKPVAAPEPQAPIASTQPPVALAQVKKRRRPWLWVTAILLVAVGALLTGAVANMVKETVPVVVSTRDVPRGTTLTRDDLATVEIHPDPSIRSVSAADLDDLVGQIALIDVPKGNLLSPGTTSSEVALPDGQALVGVALTPPQMPAGELKPGQIVQLVSTPRAGDDVTDAAPVISVEATVVATAPVTDTNLTVVNVHVEAAEAEKVASMSATGRVGLIVRDI